jgi:carbamoyl-phosphate synthase small subunit
LLRLADGTEVSGVSFGSPVSVTGEIVFNTGMVGYPEALTDPSYAGQILVLTYPLIGNYGVPDHSLLDAWGLHTHFESVKIHVAALVVAEYNEDASHWNSKASLGAWLRSQGVPAITGVDTRALTQLLRETGAITAALEMEGEQ